MNMFFSPTKNGIVLIKFLFLLIIFTSLISGAEFIDAKESTLSESHIYVDNNPIETTYVLKEGSLLVPAIFLKETGSLVDWNETYETIVFRLGDVYFSHPTGSNVVYLKNGDTWDREQLAVSSVNVDGQTFVPLYDIAEHLGLDVSYKKNLKKTFIQNPIPRSARRIGSGDRVQKQIALTFDDGPDATYTPEILDILEEKGVPATFFVVGQQVEKFPKLMKRIIKDGHAIGNHSFTHRAMADIQSRDVHDELHRTQEAIFKTVNKRPDLFRPPYGRLTRADEDLLYKEGFRMIIWSVDTMDWTGLSGDEIYSRVINDISPGGVILQHNIDVNSGMVDGTVEALPRIIDELQKQGYTFVTTQTLLD